MKSKTWHYDYNTVALRYSLFKTLLSDGYTLSDIAVCFDVTRQAISHRLRSGPPTYSEHARNPVFLHSSRHGRNRARALARHRDNYTCQGCGLHRTPEYVRAHSAQCAGLKGRIKEHDVHHLNGQCGKNTRGYDSTTSIDSLITLCHRCHFNRHDHAYRL